MLIFQEARLVFLAVPKTGSTAVEAAFSPYADIAITSPPREKHMRYDRFRREVFPRLQEKGIGEIETVAMMRHPIDHLLSWWRYGSRDAKKGKPVSTAGISFPDYVAARFLPSAQRPVFAMGGSQRRMFVDEEGNVAVDHIFRYEDFDALVAFLKSRLGVNPEIPRLNVSPSQVPTLENSLYRRLNDYFADEIELYESLPSRGHTRSY
jgi:hypothetical protein